MHKLTRIYLLLAVLIPLLVVGCGDDDDDNSPPAGDNGSQNPSDPTTDDNGNDEPINDHNPSTEPGTTPDDNTDPTDDPGTTPNHDEVNVSLTRFPQSVASGDPSPTTIVLWTRIEAASDAGDKTLSLEMARDASFTDMQLEHPGLTAAAAHDHCLKVKVSGLQPDTEYFYRFRFDQDDQTYYSPTGRTKTFPSADSHPDRVNFVVTSGNNYADGYFNIFGWLVAQDQKAAAADKIDFVVHVGDYIYETEGGTGPRDEWVDARVIEFDDAENAIPLAANLAASSLDNYRQLYRTYRADAQFRRLHEQFPFIVIWDDHEFSDDSWQITGTYFGGTQDEANLARRQRAEQAFFEYIPIDHGKWTDVGNNVAVGFADLANELYPHAKIEREIQYGTLLDVIMTDYRSDRADHYIPEDACPGTVVLDKEALITILGGEANYAAVKANFGPYVDLAALPEPYAGNQATYLQVLTAALAAQYTQEYARFGFSEAEAAAKAQAEATGDLTGKFSAFVFNQLIQGYNATVPADQQLPVIDETTDNNLDRGIAYLHMGKTTKVAAGGVGARYAVIKPSFDLYAQVKAMETPAAFREQLDWIATRVKASQADQVVVFSSVSTNSLIWDLRAATTLPTDYQNQFYANVDQWDGFPTLRQELIDIIGDRPNAKSGFLVSGDIHASFVGKRADKSGDVIPDFTTTSASSTVFKTFVREALAGLTANFDEASQALANQFLVENLDLTLIVSDPENLLYAKTDQNGIAVFTVEPDRVTAQYHLIDDQDVKKSYYDNLDELPVTTDTFEFGNGVVSQLN